MDLIARFYDANEGTVTLDGQNVKDYSRKELREKIGVVPQKAALFQGTIRDNLSWGREDATDAEMWEALTTAQAREIVEKKTASLISVWNKTAGTFPVASARDLPLPAPL